MRVVLAGLALLVVAAPAVAAPGDPRSLQGVLEWPTALANERFLVMRGDDGGQFVVSLGDAQRLAPAPIRAGERVSVTGYEGTQAWQIDAFAVGTPTTLPAATPAPQPNGATQAAGAGGAAPAPSVTAQPSPVPPPGPPVPGPVSGAPATPQAPIERLHGRIVSTSGPTIVLRSDDGQRYTVDLSPLTAQQLLQTGQEVTIFGRRVDDRLDAVGIVQVQEEGAASASPLQR